MNKVRKARSVLTEEGVGSLARKTVESVFPDIITDSYRTRIWPRLPVRANYGTYNDVEIKGTHPMYLDPAADTEIQHRLLDRIIPLNTPSHIPNFKQTNVTQIKQTYQNGDRVVIIGGGNGVSAIHSARQVGKEGEVIIYEADSDRMEDIRRTIEHNCKADICQTNLAVVGQPYHVETMGKAGNIDPSCLPNCTALEMDCEGAELDILKALEQQPDTIIVELHHKKEFAPYSTATEVRTLLETMGYSVERHDGPWVDGLLRAEQG